MAHATSRHSTSQPRLPVAGVVLEALPQSALALRYASALLTHQVSVKIFLLADGVGVTKGSQKTPTGYYNTANMLSELIAKGVKVKT